MTRRYLPHAALAALLVAPLALAACGDADVAEEPVATSSQMPPGASDVDAMHGMPDGTMMAGAEHEHMAAGAAGGTADPEVVGGVQVVEIEAGRMGYQPRHVRLEAGVPARLVFTRTVDDECSSRITIPAYDIARDLPLGEPVAVEFTPTEAGELEFVCGMDMQRGTVAIAS